MGLPNEPTKGLDRVEDLIRTVPEGEETVFDLLEETTGGAKAKGAPQRTIRITRRRVRDEPPLAPLRQPSPRRAHQFHDVAALAAYLGRFGRDDGRTVVLADATAGIIAAVLDEETADGFEIVTCIPQVHPLFAPWDEVLFGDAENPPAAMPLKAFVDFLAENRRAIVEPDGRELVAVLSRIKVSRKIELYEGRGAAAHLNGLLVETRIGGQDQKEPVDLPDTLTIQYPVFLACPPSRMEVDLLLDARGIQDDGGAAVFVRAVSSEAAEVKVGLFEHMVEQLQKALGKKTTIGFGCVRHLPWDVLKA